MRDIRNIMLIDDNKIDNFFHQRVIKKYDETINVIIAESGQEALDYLTANATTVRPDLIFLDINMPGMNGWEFIEHYSQLDKQIHNSIIVVMLTTSGNPDEEETVKNNKMIGSIRTKPLTIEMLQGVIANMEKQ
jgi:CheY-like chemotaxis protein